MASRADDIADALLQRAITLAQLEAGEQQRVQFLLLPFWRRVRAEVLSQDPTAPSTLAGRLRQVRRIVETVTELTAAVFGAIAATHATVRAAVARWVATGTAEALQAIGEAALLARPLSERVVERVADTALVLGASITDWWRRQAATVQQAIGDRLRQDVLQEQPLLTVLADMEAVRLTATRAADGLVQTSLASVQQATLARLIEGNRRRVGAVQARATFDTRACVRCLFLSGQAWDANHQPLAGSGPWPGEPPWHWH